MSIRKLYVNHKLTSKMHIILFVQSNKTDKFCFYDFDLGGHFRGHLGHAKHEIMVIRKLHLNLRVYIKNAFNIICFTNQGRHILFL